MLARKTFVALVCLVVASCSDTARQSASPEETDVRSMPDRSLSDSLTADVQLDSTHDGGGDSSDDLSDAQGDRSSDIRETSGGDEVDDDSETGDSRDDVQDAEVIEIPSDCGDGIATGESCTSDDDCGNDSYCDVDRCLFYESGRRCGASDECLLAPHGDPPEPAVQCRYLTPEPTHSRRTTGVAMTPMVADLDLDGTSEIIFVQIDNVNPGLLTVINGEDCSLFWDEPLDFPRFWAESQLAIADLNGDDHPDIVGRSASHPTVVAVDHTGELLWVAHDGEDELGTRVNWGGVSIADLDADGSPEVILIDTNSGIDRRGVYVLRSDGQLWWNEVIEPVNSVGTSPAIADVDGDEQLEIITGNRILGPDGTDETPEGWADLDLGHVAIADFDVDNPGPEVAVVWTPTAVGVPSGIHGGVRIQTVAGDVLMDLTLPGYGQSGPPSVADFDADGQAEIGVVNAACYMAIDLECGVDEWADLGCADRFIRWQREVQDGSGSTTSSAFDFGADGRNEVLYGDECYLRIMDGSNGDVVATVPNPSGTTLENPIVADVDGDFNTELVLPSSVVDGNTCDGPPVDCSDELGDPSCELEPIVAHGITVLNSPTDRWVNSRSIWNQHAYHITNIDDDGTVPVDEEDSWVNYNSYRRNDQVRGKALAAPDLTVRIVTVNESGCPEAMTLTVQVANRGAYPVGPGIPVTVRVEDEWACTLWTTVPLYPEDTEDLECEIERGERTGSVSLRAEVDLDSDGASLNTECVEGNNWAEVPEASCF